MDLKLYHELSESTLVRGKPYLAQFEMRDILDFTFLYFLAFQIMRSEPEESRFLQQYIYNTTKFDSNYTHYKQHGNDMYQFLHLLFGKENSTDLLKQTKSHDRLVELASPNKTDMNWLLANMRHNRSRNIAFENRFFIQLESDLMITNSNYRAIRRLVRDWDKIEFVDKQNVMTRLIQAFRTRMPKSELRRELESFASKLKLYNDKATNPELNESEQLNELRELIDINEYGGWITADKKVHYVDSEEHIVLARKMTGIHDWPANYNEMFKNGAIRYVTDYNELNIEGNLSDINKLRGIWMPTARNSDAVYIDLKDQDGPVMSLALPKDNAKLNKLLRSEPDLVTESRMTEATQQLNELRDYIDINEYGGWISPDKKVHHVDDFSHQEWVQQNIVSTRDPGAVSYRDAYEQGYVRFVYRGRISLQGNLKDIKALMPIWWPTVVNNDAGIVIDGYKSKHETFEPHAKRAEILKFLNQNLRESIAEATTGMPNQFWYNPGQRKMIRATEEHMTMIINDPELFGLTDDDVDELMTAYFRDNVYTEMLKAANENGWVRGGREWSNDGIYLQSVNDKDLLNAARHINKLEYLENLLLDNKQDSFNLHGDEVVRYLRTGRKQ